MKVSIGTNIKEGPWGGGNLFAINLKNYLEKNGHTVIHDLKDNDIDLILITEPRKTSESSAFTHVEVLKYLSYVKEDAMVVHRFNECDERKNTNYVNKYLINANKIADHTVFVSEWLRSLYKMQGFGRIDSDVIYAGANKEIFNTSNFKPWDKANPIKIVTHHWGANWNKGFEYYLLLDSFMDDEKWKKVIEFTYIGNIPKKVNFKNTKVLQPLSGLNLAKEIKKNDMYLTGSINEPSGNHHIEAAQCGLPLLYINSGGIPEYCDGFGTMFNDKRDFEDKLSEAIKSYETISQNIQDYPYSAEIMSEDFLNLFNKMVENKKDYLDKRIITLNNSFISRKLYSFKRI
jgi:glycosyltransferase involved in cell wall biosynthesis